MASDSLHYIVQELIADDSDPDACLYREVETRYATREALCRDLIDGQYSDVVRIMAFDPKQADVSAEIAQEISNLAWKEGSRLPLDIIEFCEEAGVIVPEIERKR